MEVNASQRCIDLIIGSEGKKTRLPDGRFKSYLDTLPTNPVWTIWAGLTKGVGRDTVWSEEECVRRFHRELNTYEDAIERMVTVALNQNQQDALISLVYNIGPGDPAATRAEDKRGFYWSTLRKLLNQGQYEQAAGQFKRYNKSGGVVYNGLITRRAREAALFLEPMNIQAAPVIEAENGEAPAIDHETVIPQSVDAPSISVTKAAAKSPSVLSAFLGMASSAIATAYGWVSGVASDATVEVGKAAPSVSGLDALWHLLRLNTAAILGFVTLACLAVVLVRKLAAIREGA